MTVCDTLASMNAARTWVRRVNDQNVTIVTSEVDGLWRAECRAIGSVATGATEMMAIWLVEADIADEVWRVERQTIITFAAVLAVALFALAVALAVEVL